MIDEAIDIPIHANRNNDRTEFAWVIEKGDSDTSRPIYWSGDGWSGQHENAVRFARKLDALTVSGSVLKDVDVRVAEHGWG